MKEKMRRFCLLISLMIVVGGCVSSAPHDNADFRSVDQLRALDGTYQNRGEGEEGLRTIFLSGLVWPSATNIDHHVVTTVEVRAADDHSLLVRAYATDALVKEELFIQGEDFTLHGGRIRLTHGLHIAGFKSGEPLIGSYYENTELGIDQTGQGKFRPKGAVAGFVYALLPMALGSREDVRFVKTGN